MATWLAEIHNHFYQMILNYHPGALVVLAHWAAVLVKRAEHFGCWYLKDSARTMVQEVTGRLSAINGALLVLFEAVRDFTDRSHPC